MSSGPSFLQGKTPLPLPAKNDTNLIVLFCQLLVL